MKRLSWLSKILWFRLIFSSVFLLHLAVGERVHHLVHFCFMKRFCARPLPNRILLRGRSLRKSRQNTGARSMPFQSSIIFWSVVYLPHQCFRTPFASRMNIWRQAEKSSLHIAFKIDQRIDMFWIFFGELCSVQCKKAGMFVLFERRAEWKKMGSSQYDNCVKNLSFSEFGSSADVCFLHFGGQNLRCRHLFQA